MPTHISGYRNDLRKVLELGAHFLLHEPAEREKHSPPPSIRPFLIPFDRFPLPVITRIVDLFI